MVTIVVPFLNEQENLPVLYDRVAATMTAVGPFELLLVDDGSTDGSARWVASKAREDPRVRLLQLSRNFGHQIAITAGLDHAEGDAVVIMDADLQDPPEVIPELVAKWREGHEVVYGVRKKRESEQWPKRLLAAAFYRILRHLARIDIPMDAGDFRLIDRKVVDALKDVRELHRFMRGLTCWVGFRQCAVSYERQGRHRGETKYPVWKSLHLAFDAVTSFSATPLRWAVGLGLATCVIGVAWVARIVWGYWFEKGHLEPGWASLMSVMVLMGGIQLLCIGVLGQYVGRIFEESKRRPLYFLK